MLSRRAALSALVGSVCGAALGVGVWRRRGRRTAHRPYFLQIVLGGGPDAIFGLDPKVAADVAPGIDAPLVQADIVTRGAIALGPHLAPLIEHADRMTVLRGVLTSTAAHLPGVASLLRGQRGLTPMSPAPTLDQIVGSYRDGQAVGSVTLGEPFTTMGVSAKYLSEARIEELLAMSPEDLATCAALVAAQRGALGRRAVNERDRETLETLDDTRRLFERLIDIPRPPPGPPATDENALLGQLTRSLQLAHWLFKHDLARAASIVYFRWDSHIDNTNAQAELAPTFQALRDFLDAMAADTNGRPGSMLDQTIILAGGELGRFPYLNLARGKHHFPEVSMVLLGAHLRPGVFGATGREMQSVPIDWATGRPTEGGTQPTLDDVGATVLRLADIDPAHHGYGGRILPGVG